MATFHNVDNSDWFRVTHTLNGAVIITAHTKGANTNIVIPAAHLTDPVPSDVVTACYQRYIAAYNDGTMYPASHFEELKMVLHDAGTMISDMTAADAAYAGFIDHLLIALCTRMDTWLPVSRDYGYRVDLEGLVLVIDDVEYAPPQFADDATPVTLTRL